MEGCSKSKLKNFLCNLGDIRLHFDVKLPKINSFCLKVWKLFLPNPYTQNWLYLLKKIRFTKVQIHVDLLLISMAKRQLHWARNWPSSSSVLVHAGMLLKATSHEFLFKGLFNQICVRNYRPSFRENKPRNARFQSSRTSGFGLVLAKTGSMNSGTDLFFLRQNDGSNWLLYKAGIAYQLRNVKLIRVRLRPLGY